VLEKVSPSRTYIDIASTLTPYMQMLFGFLALLHSDPDKSEDTLKSMVGIIGYFQMFSFLTFSDVAEAFPGGELREFFQQEWISECLKQARSRPGYRSSTRETARWARELVRAQLQ
jgi:importin subunit beta-1